VGASSAEAASRRRRSPSPGPWLKNAAADLTAGLQGAVSSVPGGMATAVLAGVHPVQGLYACCAGPIVGGLTSRTRLMVISTSGAVALAASSAIRGVPEDRRPAAVALLTLLVAAALVGAGLLRLGRYTRFVSHSVMMGFLTGISVNIICGQVSGLTGAAAHGHIPVLQAASIVLHPGRINPAALLTGLAAIVIIAVTSRTRLGPAGMLLAIVLPTVVVAASGAGSVARVRDEGRIQPGIPLPQLPDFRQFSYGMITGALAVAAIIIVQGAGIGEMAAGTETPSPGGSRDIVAQAMGNLASSVFRGIPVGGSVGQTAINVRSGGRTRLAAISSGVWLGVILVAFSGAVGDVAVPTLAAVLVFFGASSLQPGELRMIWRTGPISQVAVVTTLAATLLLPVAAAVGTGVALSLLLQLNQGAMDLRVVELIPLEDGRLAEAAAPERLRSEHVTVLDVYGSLLYAGARTLQVNLPDPVHAERAVVVLRLRRRTELGATFIRVISEYAERLAQAGGRIYLSGLDREVIQRLGSANLLGSQVMAVEATPILGESTYHAFVEAKEWLVHREDGAEG
jgi:sulfate permease, SulP family